MLNRKNILRFFLNDLKFYFVDPLTSRGWIFLLLKKRIIHQIKGIFSDDTMQCHTLLYTLSYINPFSQRRLKLDKITAYIK